MNRPALALLIALALVTVGCVFYIALLFLRPSAPVIAGPTIPAAQPFEKIVGKALAGYNRHDAAALFADFATSAIPPATGETHRALFEGYYQETFGACRGLRLNVTESEILPDRALLVWDATFSKVKMVKLSANFITESGPPRIVQLRIEKAEARR
jgi:hypothetical protein